MSKIYRTIQDDSFDAIAFRIWGDEHLGSMIMNANPDNMDVLLFDPGVELVIPDYTPPAKTSDLPPWYGD